MKKQTFIFQSDQYKQPGHFLFEKKLKKYISDLHHAVSYTQQEKLLSLPRQYRNSGKISTEQAIIIAREIDFEKQEELFKEQFE
jgi:hypothetical protein